MCKSGLTSYKIDVFYSTSRCGKLVENVTCLRKTFEACFFPPSSTSFKEAVCGKVENILSNTANKRLMSYPIVIAVWKSSSTVSIAKDGN
jgi:hypothetical protein